MATLEQEIIEKFHRLDKAAQQRVRAVIERETETDAPDEHDPIHEYQLWVDFINSIYGSLADNPLEESDNSQLPLSVRDEFE